MSWDREPDAVRWVEGVPQSRPEWGTVRTGRFQPTRIDNLRPEALALVGQIVEVEFAGTMDDGPYDGQPIWEATDRALRLGWIPNEDLADTV
jgi:hypothetical protein